MGGVRREREGRTRTERATGRGRPRAAAPPPRSRPAQRPALAPLLQEGGRRRGRRRVVLPGRQDVLRLMQGVDFLLPSGLPVFVGGAALDACLLQVTEVLGGYLVLLLDVLLLGAERRGLLDLPLLLLVLDLRLLQARGLLDVAVLHLLLVELLVALLLHLGVGLHLGKLLVRLLKHRDDAGACLLRVRDPRVRGVPGGRRVGEDHGSWLLAALGLHQLPRLLLDHSALLVVRLQDGDGVRDRRLRILGVFRGHGILLLPDP